jgi:CheY-like chemotaxis protein
VLLVEDEPAVRAMTTLVLREQGYHVLEAVNGEDALELVRVRDMVDRINLLMTDVVMPRMGGKELADRMKQIRPDIKVLFMSGYNDEVVNQHGIVAPEVEFLQKPTSLQLLARKVREVLDKGTPKVDFGLE